LAEEKYPYPLTHRFALSEIIRSIDTATAVKGALHEDATEEEKASLADLLAKLQEAQGVLEEVECPNGMFSSISINKSQLEKIAKTIE